MLTFRDFSTALRKLDIDRSRPVIAHASLSAFGEIQSGAEAVLGALLMSFNTLIMPTFTYNTMIIPEVGPPDNAISYGSGKDINKMAEFFHPDMPADKMMGSMAEALRRHPKAHRSMHPILSFAGANAEQALDAQTLDEPLLPLHSLRQEEGWVLLMGVNQTVNTSIHYAEMLAGRKQFTRWALTPKGVVTCEGFPGCSDGFETISPRLDGVVRRVEVGEGVIQAMPMVNLVDIACGMLAEDPLALLCVREDCERCNVLRASVTKQ